MRKGCAKEQQTERKINWHQSKEVKEKLKKMELIYILNVMIIINDKFNFTPKARREENVAFLPIEVGF